MFCLLNYFGIKKNKKINHKYNNLRNEHNKNSSEIYDKEENLIGKLENIIAYEIAEYINDKEEKENLLLVGKNIQINEKKKICYFSVYNIKDLSKPMKEIEISLTDRMKLRISPDNKYI